MDVTDRNGSGHQAEGEEGPTAATTTDGSRLKRNTLPACCGTDPIFFQGGIIAIAMVVPDGNFSSIMRVESVKGTFNKGDRCAVF